MSLEFMRDFLTPNSLVNKSPSYAILKYSVRAGCVAMIMNIVLVFLLSNADGRAKQADRQTENSVLRRTCMDVAPNHQTLPAMALQLAHKLSV